MSKKSRKNKRAGIPYFIREGLSSIFVHGFTSIAAVSVIAACLMITGNFALVAHNIDLKISELESQSEIVVYVDESLSREEAQGLEKQIRAIPNVRDARFVEKEKLLDDYLVSLGEDAYVMEGLREDNPLRDSFEITMRDVDLHAETVKKLEEIDGIASSSSMEEASRRLVKLRHVTRMISVALVALLGAVSVFIIANTVKLAMFARKDEIAVMKMVGATNHFIRAPFVVEGMFLGITAAFVAFFVLWGVYSYITGQMVEGTAILEMIPFTAVWGRALSLMLGAGLILGAGGSALTIRRFLKV